MMRFLMLSLALVACGGEKTTDDTDSGDSGTVATSPFLADAEAEMQDYSTWNQMVEGKVPGTSIHGSFVEIFINDVAWDVIQAGAGGDMPDGAMLVKNSHSSEDSAIGFVTAMYKADGQWLWIRYPSPDAAADVVAHGAGDCQDCHDGGQDGVFVATW